MKRCKTRFPALLGRFVARANTLRPARRIAARVSGPPIAGGGLRRLQHQRANSAVALNATNPNIKWPITLAAPRTRPQRPPYRSFNRLFTRSLALRSWKRCACSPRHSGRAGRPGSRPAGAPAGVPTVWAARVGALRLAWAARLYEAPAGPWARVWARALRGASMAVASRLTWPTSFAPACVWTICSWICWGNWSCPNTAKARLKVGSLGISPGRSQPQSCRNRGRDFRASSNAPVVGN
jgi:hypothetical protein